MWDDTLVYCTLRPNHTCEKCSYFKPTHFRFASGASVICPAGIIATAPEIHSQSYLRFAFDTCVSDCLDRALSVILPFWDAAAVWEAQAFRGSAHYAALALFTWNLDNARGTKATVALMSRSRGEIPTPTDTLLCSPVFVPMKIQKSLLGYKQKLGNFWSSGTRHTLCILVHF